MTSEDPGSVARTRRLTDHDRDRLRTARRVALVGPGVGVLAALGLGLAGGGGRLGLAALLLCSAAGCVVAAVVALLHAAVDEARRQPVALRRIGWAIALMLVALVIMVLLGGVVSGAAT